MLIASSDSKLGKGSMEDTSHGMKIVGSQMAMPKKSVNWPMWDGSSVGSPLDLTYSCASFWHSPEIYKLCFPAMGICDYIYLLVINFFFFNR